MMVGSVEEMEEVVFETEAGSPRAAQPFVRAIVGVVALAFLFLGVLVVRGWRPGSDGGVAKQTSAAGASPVMPTSAAIESTYGIRFTLVDVTAGGGMIQLHYQVLDSNKTEAIHGTELAPYVIDSRGVKYADPGMVGHSHVGKTQAAGTTDYILLANAQGAVKPGSFVTLKVGDLELRNVPVV